MTGREAARAESGGDPGFAPAEQVADAVLYEGYALYPYRANSLKNQMRFQWGVLVPRGYTEQDPFERTRNRTQCLVEEPGDGRLRVRVRFLHLEERSVQVQDQDGSWEEVDYLDLGDAAVSHWDEAEEQRIDLDASFPELARGPLTRTFALEGSQAVADLGDTPRGPARELRRRRALSGLVMVHGEPVAEAAWRVTVDVSNRTPGDGFSDRAEALRHSLVTCHTMLTVDTGRFISLLAPPGWADPEVDHCENQGVYPVLIGPEDGEHRLMLSSPIILYDHPRVAPESPGDLFDATEIDEILTLRTMTLTDEEKRQARSTDPRTAALMDRVDHLPPELLGRLHGTLRRDGEMPLPRHYTTHRDEPE